MTEASIFEEDVVTGVWNLDAVCSRKLADDLPCALASEQRAGTTSDE